MKKAPRPPPEPCPCCNGPISRYAEKKYGCCVWCIRLDSGGGAYRIRFNRKYKRMGDEGGPRNAVRKP